MTITDAILLFWSFMLNSQFLSFSYHSIRYQLYASNLQREPASLRDEPCAEAAVVGVDEGADVALAVHRSEVHRVARGRRGALFHVDRGSIIMNIRIARWPYLIIELSQHVRSTFGPMKRADHPKIDLMCHKTV